MSDCLIILAYFGVPCVLLFLFFFSLYNLVMNKVVQNFATASRSRCPQNSLTMELVDNIYDGRHVVAIHCMLVSCRPNPLTPLFRFVVDLSYNLFRYT